METLGTDNPDYASAVHAFLNSERLTGRVTELGKLSSVNDHESAWANAALMRIGNARQRGGANGPRDQASAILTDAWKDTKRHESLLKGVTLAADQGSRDYVLAALKDPNPTIVASATTAAKVLQIDPSNPGPRPTGPKIESMKLDRALDAATKAKGDKTQGERLFTQLNCVNCHTVKQTDPPKGPYLGTIATTYKRRELAEAILQPSKTIAQGFATNVFALEDGRTLTGFVTKEAADVVIIRDVDGRETSIPTSNIVERAKSTTSVMPEGVVGKITIGEFASLLDYLESLSKK